MRADSPRPQPQGPLIQNGSRTWKVARRPLLTEKALLSRTFVPGASYSISRAMGDSLVDPVQLLHKRGLHVPRFFPLLVALRSKLVEYDDSPPS
ncbi:hypothetical protein NDU88_004373 [Pleurodeles waltl]|uniref:Uncharacterized protein n=1 Tax=Pleurodeles waltl TaxID=8319 RepID=A0AAV7T7S3_PLEWA|nr:hypothetical protein NDU88_004373 [Pleurodeles waltl]